MGYGQKFIFKVPIVSLRFFLTNMNPLPVRFEKDQELFALFWPF